MIMKRASRTTKQNQHFPVVLLPPPILFSATQRMKDSCLRARFSRRCLTTSSDSDAPPTSFSVFSSPAPLSQTALNHADCGVASCFIVQIEALLRVAWAAIKQQQTWGLGNQSESRIDTRLTKQISLKYEKSNTNCNTNMK